jgi:hypothetical protein
MVAIHSIYLRSRVLKSLHDQQSEDGNTWKHIDLQTIINILVARSLGFLYMTINRS